MKQLSVEIVGDGSLVAGFTIQDVINGNKQSKKNVRRTSFDVNEGKKYALLVEIQGEEGEKYKVKIDNATKATYPESEQTLDGVRDILLARITA